MEWTEGDVIRKLRSAVGWTLADLATATGVNIDTIHKMERGLVREPKRTTLDRLGVPFGLTWQQICAAVPPPSDLVIKIVKPAAAQRRKPPRQRVAAADRHRRSA